MDVDIFCGGAAGAAVCYYRASFLSARARARGPYMLMRGCARGAVKNSAAGG